VVLGSGEDGSTGYLNSNACSVFYETFDLESGDPMIFNNNFPLRKLPLPDTGFAPGQVTELAPQPTEKQYQDLDGYWLEIPDLDLQTELVGVPAVDGDWDTTWLADQAGYLEGTAFPTWTGNTVITGHVWNADNTPGVFVDLKTLAYGDEIKIHAFGATYVYQVQNSRRISPNVPGPVFEHKDGDWLTLFTCEKFAEYWEDYSYRRMVQAVLVRID
jgi:LPXTG-site transpeptidase (sortase) family protein